MVITFRFYGIGYCSFDDSCLIADELWPAWPARTLLEQRDWVLRLLQLVEGMNSYPESEINELETK